MRLTIQHKTRYAFSQSVFLEPHYLLFRPQHREYYELEAFDLQIDPTPGGLCQRLTEENNAVHQVWFNDLLDEVNFTITMNVRVGSYNPYNFFIDPRRAGQEKILDSYMMTFGDLDEEIDNWLDQVYTSSSDDLDFIQKLNAAVEKDWSHEEREEQNILSTTTCFHQRSGSCRDLSWMVIQMLRKYKIPARFVSGYAFNPELAEGHELHAWVEAFLPGAGWIGVDPASGLMTSNCYIPVATSFDPVNTLPVTGTFRGNASSSLETTVLIRNEDQ